MSEPLRIAIAGLGTVGAATASLLQKHAQLYADRCGRELRLVAVSSRNRNKDRGFDLEGVRWVEDARQLAADPEVDMVIELIGGAEGVAYDLVTDALKHKKHVVTANKALLAEKAEEIIPLVERASVGLGYEAAVAGAIPIIRTIKEGLSANNIQRIRGILNGTCNYILTEMNSAGRDFEDVLKEAQAMGYAESPPDLDVDGHDAAHKLAIITALAYGCPVKLEGLYTEGIRAITPADFAYAKEMGYTIRLLGVTEKVEGEVLQRVHPCLIPMSSPLARVEKVLNAAMVECNASGTIMLTGAGAGGRATASAVIADIIDIARGNITAPLGVPSAAWGEVKFREMKEYEGEHYVRMQVQDKSGVLAKITATLSKQEIGVETVLQRADESTQTAQLALITHKAKESAIIKALETIAKLDFVIEKPHRIRVEE